MSAADPAGERTPARQRLQRLPEVFTGPELAACFGWKSGIASTYLANWRAAGLVRPLGGRSDVHMNLVVNPQVNPEAALRRVFPLSCRLGVDVLRESGWTTQIPSLPEVAVPSDGPLYAVHDFDLVHRSQAWFRKVLPGVEFVQGGVDRLRPAWALADMIARAQDRRVQHAWLLDPEDIDLEAAAADRNISSALLAFEVDPVCITPEGYGAIYDCLQPGVAFSTQGSRRDARQL